MTTPTDPRGGQPYGQDVHDWPADQTARREDVVSLSDYVGMLRRRWIPIAACAVIGAMLGGLAWSATPATYEARALVALLPLPNQAPATSNPRNDVNAGTELNIAQSNTVADRARQQLDRDFPDENYEELRPGQIRDRSTIAVPPASQTMDIRFQAENAEEAAAGATALAQAYLTVRRDQAARHREDRAEEIEAQRLRREEVVRDLTRQLGALPPTSNQRASIDRQRQEVLDSIGVLLEQEDIARTASVNPGTIVDAASPPRLPVAPRLPIFVAGGLLLGLIAGLAYALWREYRDDHIRGARDLIRAGGARQLASIKVPRRIPAGAGLALLTAQDGPEADGYRLLAAKLQAPHLQTGRRVLFTGSPGSDPRVAANVAIALTRMGRSVLLLTAPQTLTASFGALGLTEAAIPAPGALTVVSPTALPGLSLAPVRDDDLAGAAATAAGMPTDFVLVDDSADPAAWKTLALANDVDGVILVATAGRHGRRKLGALCKELSSTGARILGGVLLVGSRVPAPPAATRGPAPQPAQLNQPQAAGRPPTGSDAPTPPGGTPAPRQAPPGPAASTGPTAGAGHAQT